MSGFVASALTGLLLGLRPASFRGVAFGVKSGGKDLGRRVVTHKFPLRDTVMHEDLGRRERTLTVEGFIVGYDLASRMRRLEAALERQGPGRLVHPHYGSLDVVVTAAKVATGEAKDLATISITCELHDPAGQQPSGAGNGGSLVDSLGLSAVVAFAEEYSSLLTVSGMQDFVVEQLGGQLGGLGVSLAGIASAYGLARQVQSNVLGLTSWLSSGSRDGSAATVTAAVGSLGVTGATGTRPDALLVLAATGVPAPATSTGTPGRDAVARNALALDLLVRACAAAEAARTVAAMDWESRDQALGYRDQVAEALDGAADRAGDLGWDLTWRALADLRAAMVAYVTAAAAPLPRLTHVTPAATISSLLLAYQIDGEVVGTLFDRAADIARRNHAPHPGFLAGGTPLELLTDG